MNTATMLALAAVQAVVLGLVAQQVLLSADGSFVDKVLGALSPGNVMARINREIRPDPSCGWLMTASYTLASQRVLLANGTVAPAVIHVAGGKIQAITATSQRRPDLDYQRLLISPGLIDTHVHMDEPGRTDWEGMEAATRAAAAGGITTVIDMPLNNIPPTTSGTLVRVKLHVAKNKLWVDAAFWGAVCPVNAGNFSQLQGMLQAGALGFKSFLSPSGSDFEHVTVEEVRTALPHVKRLGVPFYVHAELPRPVDPGPDADVRSYATWLAQRPDAFEVDAVEQLLDLLRADKTEAAPGFRLHIAHVSSAQVLPLLAQAKAEGLPVSAETCPHYLNFAAEDVPQGATQFKCAPPIRGAANREALWRALQQGTLDGLASDHSPSPPAMRLLETGDFIGAWGGIAGLQYGLPATWHQLAARKLPVQLLSTWWSTFPARMAGLSHRKGAIAVGMDADLVVWDPDALADTSAAGLHSRHKVTPYADLKLQGKVVATFVRGQQVFWQQRSLSLRSCGQTVLKGSFSA